MKNKILFALLVTGIVYAGCGGSSSNNEPASADTTSHNITTPTNDTLIKDTTLRDSAGKMNNPAPAAGSSKRGSKTGSENP